MVKGCGLLWCIQWVSVLGGGLRVNGPGILSEVVELLGLSAVRADSEGP